MTVKEYLGPLDVGVSVVAGQTNTIISEAPYVKLLSDPIWDGTQWRALANVAGMLCLVAVRVCTK